MARPVIGDEERAAVDRVLRSGVLTQGPEVADFETEFASVVGGLQCVAVNSGTSALHLALLAVGVGQGDEVVLPSFSFAATANAVRLVGGIPVFVDIDPVSFCVDPEAVREAITPRTKAILPVHVYGHPAAMDELGPLAEERGISIVEDAAQAHAATLGGRPVGTFGTAAAFSFYPTKNMTTGEGGMVTTPSATVAHQVRLLRNQGMERRYENEVIGYNNRMSDLHAAIGRAQLHRLAEWTRQRQDNARFLSENLVGVRTPRTASGATHVFHQYTVRVPEARDRFTAELARKGVATGVYYPTPIHRLPSFDQDLDLPATERACAEVFSLPVHPSLTPAELEQVVTAVNEVAKAGS
jgi:dTDP-4-amino-4,6-dideoxygalactose transaminase